MNPRNRPVPAPVLRTLAERASDYGLSRRAFLGLLGAAGGAAALGGCARSDDVLRWANYPYYLDLSEDGQSFPTLKEFTAETGIAAENFEDMEDNNSFYGKVRGRWAQGQDIGYDIVTFSNWMITRCIQLEYLQPLDHAAMPNTENLLPVYFTEAFEAYDPGYRYSMPWQSGMPVLAWSKEQVPDGIRSVSDLWRPEFKGKVEVLAELRETMGPILWSLGTNPAGDWGDDEFGNAVDLLAKHVSDGQIRDVRGSSYTEDLASGDAAVVIGYGGDIPQLNVAEDRFDWAFPEDGSTIWIDSLVVPTTSDRLEEAQKLVDYYYDPVVAAAVAAYVQYVTPVDGVREEIAKIDPTLVDNELIFPSEETMTNTVVFRPLTPEEDARYSAMFLEAIGS
ncbi:MAG: spermidine/putrescine ABC transporter substrate-binding protein [Micrococcales bacterium]|nr:spermidine/putrescine ABC transporter substrate-binding protein [Micrococcales bacterium]